MSSRCVVWSLLACESVVALAVFTHTPATVLTLLEERHQVRTSVHSFIKKCGAGQYPDGVNAQGDPGFTRTPEGCTWTVAKKKRKKTSRTSQVEFRINLECPHDQLWQLLFLPLFHVIYGRNFIVHNSLEENASASNACRVWVWMKLCSFS